jgi:hypothetical protein
MGRRIVLTDRILSTARRASPAQPHSGRVASATLYGATGNRDAEATLPLTGCGDPTAKRFWYPFRQGSGRTPPYGIAVFTPEKSNFALAAINTGASGF